MAAIPKDFDAETADNLEDIEKQFAVRAVEYASAYWNLLVRVGGRNLRLTAVDDELYNDLLETFPEFQNGTAAAENLDENVMKSKEGKAKWNSFAKRYEKTVPDYNFGTLLRLRSNGEFDQDNTMFAFRVQAIAIEIFRNRHGLNDWIFKLKN